MVLTDALTFLAMLLCGLLAVALALIQPELSVVFLIGMYYFSVFHIAHVVGGDRGWYRGVLTTYFGILALTIISFAITYYRYGLLLGGKHVDITFGEAIYFSVTTLTTLGYGDFTPTSRLRHITSAQSILGYIGMGLWVTLIANFIQNMSLNRQRVLEHNDEVIRRGREQMRGKKSEEESA